MEFLFCIQNSLSLSLPIFMNLLLRKCSNVNESVDQQKQTNTNALEFITHVHMIYRRLRDFDLSCRFIFNFYLNL